MKNLYRATVLMLSLLASFSAVGAGPSIWAQLKQGGYVILMRHAPVDTMTHSTHPRADFENCVGQNNLSPLGQQEAARMGRAFKKKRIPIGEVLTSPFCRTQDTGRIAFGKTQVWDALELQTSLPEEEAVRRLEAVAARVGQYQGKKNLVLISHQPNIDALTLELVETGTILILKPLGGSGFNVVERITLEQLPK